jgi:hypothetical protein
LHHTDGAFGTASTYAQIGWQTSGLFLHYMPHQIYGHAILLRIPHSDLVQLIVAVQPGCRTFSHFLAFLLLADVRQGQVGGLIGLSALPAQPVSQFLAKFFLGAGLRGQIARHTSNVLYGSQGAQGSHTSGLFCALLGGLFVQIHSRKHFGLLISPVAHDPAGHGIG